MSNGKTPGRRGRVRAGDDVRIPAEFPALSALIRQEPLPPGPSAKSAAGKNGKADAKAQAKWGTGKRGPYNKFRLQIGKDEPDPGTFQVSEIIHKDELKRSYMEWAIRKVKGDRPLAAKLTGISLRTFYNWFGGPDDERPDS
jgi:hypothetical protein